MAAKSGAMEDFIKTSLKHPELTPQRIVVMKEELLGKVATPARMRLVKIIRKSSPRSVGGLAALAKRPIEAVSRDLRILCFYGLVELVQTGKQKQPRIEKEFLVIPLK
jgi:predicted transcriptional regulator